MEKPTRLNSGFVEKVKEPGRYGDGRGGNGLSLRVRLSRSGKGLYKSWEQRVHYDGKVTTLGLGSYPSLKLTAARELAAHNAQRIRARFPRWTALDRILGADSRPAAPVRGLAPVVGASVDSAAPTFSVLAAEFIETQRSDWKAKTEAQVSGLLDQYILPVMGHSSVAAVSPEQVYDVLSPIWQTRAPTAKKVKMLLSGIFRVAVSKGYRDDDPVARGCLGLGKQRHVTEHHEAIPYEQVAEALMTVRQSASYESKKLALELLVLTATRTSEVRGMRWREVDWEQQTWTIPEERMKGGREHRVPLSWPSMVVLYAAGGQGEPRDDLVFKSASGKMLSHDGLRRLLQRKYRTATPHGFRSSFRNWAAEQTDYPAEVAEHALAHLEGSATVRSYLTTTMFEKRRGMMADWAEYIGAGR